MADYQLLGDGFGYHSGYAPGNAAGGQQTGQPGSQQASLQGAQGSMLSSGGIPGPGNQGYHQLGSHTGPPIRQLGYGPPPPPPTATGDPKLHEQYSTNYGSGANVGQSPQLTRNQYAPHDPRYSHSLTNYGSPMSQSHIGISQHPNSQTAQPSLSQISSASYPGRSLIGQYGEQRMHAPSPRSAGPVHGLSSHYPSYSSPYGHPSSHTGSGDLWPGQNFQQRPSYYSSAAAAGPSPHSQTASHSTVGMHAPRGQAQFVHNQSDYNAIHSQQRPYYQTPASSSQSSQPSLMGHIPGDSYQPSQVSAYSASSAASSRSSQSSGPRQQFGISYNSQSSTLQSSIPTPASQNQQATNSSSIPRYPQQFAGYAAQSYGETSAQSRVSPYGLPQGPAGSNSPNYRPSYSGSSQVSALSPRRPTPTPPVGSPMPASSHQTERVTTNVSTSQSQTGYPSPGSNQLRSPNPVVSPSAPGNALASQSSASQVQTPQPPPPPPTNSLQQLEQMVMPHLTSSKNSTPSSTSTSSNNYYGLPQTGPSSTQSTQQTPQYSNYPTPVSVSHPQSSFYQQYQQSGHWPSSTNQSSTVSTTSPSVSNTHSPVAAVSGVSPLQSTAYSSQQQQSGAKQSPQQQQMSSLSSSGTNLLSNQTVKTNAAILNSNDSTNSSSIQSYGLYENQYNSSSSINDQQAYTTKADNSMSPRQVTTNQQLSSFDISSLTKSSYDSPQTHKSDDSQSVNADSKDTNREQDYPITQKSKNVVESQNTNESASNFYDVLSPNERTSINSEAILSAEGQKVDQSQNSVRTTDQTNSPSIVNEQQQQQQQQSYLSQNVTDQNYLNAEQNYMPNQSQTAMYHQQSYSHQSQMASYGNSYDSAYEMSMGSEQMNTLNSGYSHESLMYEQNYGQPNAMDQMMGGSAHMGDFGSGHMSDISQMPPYDPYDDTFASEPSVKRKGKGRPKKDPSEPKKEKKPRQPRIPKAPRGRGRGARNNVDNRMQISQPPPPPMPHSDFEGSFPLGQESDIYSQMIPPQALNPNIGRPPLQQLSNSLSQIQPPPPSNAQQTSPMLHQQPMTLQSPIPPQPQSTQQPHPIPPHVSGIQQPQQQQPSIQNITPQTQSQQPIYHQNLEQPIQTHTNNTELEENTTQGDLNTFDSLSPQKSQSQESDLNFDIRKASISEESNVPTMTSLTTEISENTENVDQMQCDELFSQSTNSNSLETPLFTLPPSEEPSNNASSPSDPLESSLSLGQDSKSPETQTSIPPPLSPIPIGQPIPVEQNQLLITVNTNVNETILPTPLPVQIPQQQQIQQIPTPVSEQPILSQQQQPPPPPPPPPPLPTQQLFPLEEVKPNLEAINDQLFQPSLEQSTPIQTKKKGKKRKAKETPTVDTDGNVTSEIPEKKPRKPKKRKPKAETTEVVKETTDSQPIGEVKTDSDQNADVNQTNNSTNSTEFDDATQEETLQLDSVGETSAKAKKYKNKEGGKSRKPKLKEAKSKTPKKKLPKLALKFGKKKKRKRLGQYSDNSDLERTPPPSGDEGDNGILKRRSARNTKRQKYTDDIDLELSDDDKNEGKDNKTGASAPLNDSSVLVMSFNDETMVVEKILASRIGTREIETENNEVKNEDSEEKPPVPQTVEVEEYYIKYKNLSYLHCEWKTEEELESYDKRISQKLKRFKQKRDTMNMFDFLDDEPFNPDYCEVDRILDVNEVEEITDPTLFGEPVKKEIIDKDKLVKEEKEEEKPINKDDINKEENIEETIKSEVKEAETVDKVEEKKDELVEDENGQVSDSLEVEKDEQEEKPDEVIESNDEEKQSIAPEIEEKEIADEKVTEIEIKQEKEEIVDDIEKPAPEDKEEEEEAVKELVETDSKEIEENKSEEIVDKTDVEQISPKEDLVKNESNDTTPAIVIPEVKTKPKMVRHYLVKWRALPYEECNWELEDDLDPEKVAQFWKFREPPAKDKWKSKKRPKSSEWKKLDNSPVYKSGNTLREYQLEGVNWLTFCWHNNRNCILADEMGLGKTIQSLAFIQEIVKYGISSPFLIIAPLSTIGNWQREFETWTELNVITYHGSSASRNMIQEYEMYYKNDKGERIENIYKFQVMITTFEIVLTDCLELREITWRACIIDEAHRLKNRNCKLLEGLRLLDMEHRVLLTGTPLQNNVEELFSLLNFLEPSQFASSDLFLQEFGDLKTEEQVDKLKALLKPMMLRRLKEDVEKSLAPKEETIIEVELTNIQKKYYRAILERNFQFLSKGGTYANMPNLMNTMMELRKCCIHPFLINGAEEQVMYEYRQQHGEASDAQLTSMVQASGKLVLIDKLLPRLRLDGHRVLIFSQMVRCLDILEDYLVQKRYPYERIDGRVRGNLRQAAIDRFCKPDSDRFVFLLCTRAGGLGINLTAADTVIIFDSDWNPQNDLQAQARCHRIGQSKMVKVYRLICRNTYERQMFDKASLKLGLDKAVLQSMNTQKSIADNAFSKKEVEDLLRKGAYGAIMDDDNAGDKFCEEDIEQILLRRTKVITIESEGTGEQGSTFSKASFAASDNRSDIEIDDPNFWEKWAKKAQLDVDELKGRNELIVQEPRKRTQTKRFGQDDSLLDISDVDSSDDDEVDIAMRTRGGRGRIKGKKGRKGRGGGYERERDEDYLEEFGPGNWTRAECYKVEKGLLTFGWGRWDEILLIGNFRRRLLQQDVEDIGRVILLFCLQNYKGDEKLKTFVWELITPQEFNNNQKSNKTFSNGTPPPRVSNRSKTKKSKRSFNEEVIISDWTKDESYNPDILLTDEQYRKHLSRHANKILLRIKLLHYLKHDIIGDLYEQVFTGVQAKDVPIPPPSADGDPPSNWWDEECDKSLIIGVYKHGYDRFNLMRHDSALCFLHRCGPPDGAALLAEMNNDDDLGKTLDEDEEPETPATPSDSSRSESIREEMDIANSSDQIGQLHFPNPADMNQRLRRIISAYQRNFKKQEIKLAQQARHQQRLEKLERFEAAIKEREMKKREQAQKKWSRREESDFYRVITSYGVEYNHAEDRFEWSRFRTFSRLEKKLDETLTEYFKAFNAMCKRVTGRKLTEEEENLPISVDPISEERASRALARIELLSKIRDEILTHPELDERLQLCQPSIDLPDWWICGQHDKDLLLGAAKYGLNRLDFNLMRDPELSFKEIFKETNDIISRSESKSLLIKDGESIKTDNTDMQIFLVKMPTVHIEEQKSNSNEVEVTIVEDKKQSKAETTPEKTEEAQEQEEEEKQDTEKNSSDEVTDNKGEAESNISEKNEESEPKEKEDETETKTNIENKEETVPEDLDEEKENKGTNPQESKESDKPELEENESERNKEDEKEKQSEEIKDEEIDKTDNATKEEFIEKEESELNKDEENKEEVTKDGDEMEVDEENVKDTEKDEKMDTDNKDEEAIKEDLEEKKDEEKLETDKDVTKEKEEKENENIVDNIEKDTDKDIKTESEIIKDEIKIEKVIHSNQTKIEPVCTSEDMQISITTQIPGRVFPKWPKDRALQMRIEQICHCVEKNEWPSFRQGIYTVTVGTVPSTPSITTADSSPRATSPCSLSSASREPTPHPTPDHTPRGDSGSPTPDYIFTETGSLNDSRRRRRRRKRFEAEERAKLRNLLSQNIEIPQQQQAQPPQNQTTHQQLQQQALHHLQQASKKSVPPPPPLTPSSLLNQTFLSPLFNLPFCNIRSDFRNEINEDKATSLLMPQTLTKQHSKPNITNTNTTNTNVGAAGPPPPAHQNSLKRGNIISDTMDLRFKTTPVIVPPPTPAHKPTPMVNNETKTKSPVSPTSVLDLSSGPNVKTPKTETGSVSNESNATNKPTPTIGTSKKLGKKIGSRIDALALNLQAKKMMEEKQVDKVETQVNEPKMHDLRSNSKESQKQELGKLPLGKSNNFPTPPAAHSSSLPNTSKHSQDAQALLKNANVTPNLASLDATKLPPAKASEASSILEQAAAISQDLKKWLEDHPEFVAANPNLAAAAAAAMSFTRVSSIPANTELLELPDGRRRGRRPKLDPNLLELQNLTGDENVSVINRLTGKKITGSKAPPLKHLAEWLEKNPMFDVDPKWTPLNKEKPQTQPVFKNPPPSTSGIRTRTSDRRLNESNNSNNNTSNNTSSSNNNNNTNATSNSSNNNSRRNTAASLLAQSQSATNVSSNQTNTSSSNSANFGFGASGLNPLGLNPSLMSGFPSMKMFLESQNLVNQVSTSSKTHSSNAATTTSTGSSTSTSSSSNLTPPMFFPFGGLAGMGLNNPLFGFPGFNIPGLTPGSSLADFANSAVNSEPSNKKSKDNSSSTTSKSESKLDKMNVSSGSSSKSKSNSSNNPANLFSPAGLASLNASGLPFLYPNPNFLYNPLGLGGFSLPSSPFASLAAQSGLMNGLGNIGTSGISGLTTTTTTTSSSHSKSNKNHSSSSKSSNKSSLSHNLPANIASDLLASANNLSSSRFHSSKSATLSSSNLIGDSDDESLKSLMGHDDDEDNDLNGDAASSVSSRHKDEHESDYEKELVKRKSSRNRDLKNKKSNSSTSKALS